MDYTFLVAGALGGLVKALLEGEHKLAVPKFQDGYLYLGFLENVIIGALVAFFIGTDIKTAFTTGIASNFVIEGVIEKVKGK